MLVRIWGLVVCVVRVSQYKLQGKVGCVYRKQCSTAVNDYSAVTQQPSVKSKHIGKKTSIGKAQ